MKTNIYNDTKYSEGQKNVRMLLFMQSYERFYQKGVIVKEVNKGNHR